MDYLKKTLEYLFVQGKGKRFFLLWLFLLPPCVILGFCFPTAKYIGLLYGFRTAEYPSFTALWKDSFIFSGWIFLGLAIALVLFIFGLSYVSAIITRHIRVGKFTFPNFWRAVNNNFFQSLTVTALFLLVTILAHLLFTGLTYMWLQLASRTLGLVMTVLFFILILVGMAYLLASTTLWLPLMSFSGMYVYRALGVAFYKSRNCQRKFFIPCLCAVAVAIAIGFAGYYVQLWYVDVILHALVYSIVLTISVAFSFISYCEIESVKREDLARLYFGR